MQSIIQMSKELSQKYYAVVAKLLITVIMFLLLCFSSYIAFMMISFFFIKIIPVAISGFVSFILMFVFYSVLILFSYGVMILITRLERNQNVSLGYLFLGFRQRKRISTVVNIFATLLFLCVMFSSFPMIKSINFSSQEGVQELLNNVEQLQKLAYMTVFLFVVIFVLFFFRFVFSWIVIYDNKETPALISLSKSSLFLKGKTINFIVFELFINKILLAVLSLTYLLPLIFPNISNQLIVQVLSISFSILRISSFILLISKVCFSIPFYYDKKNNQNSVIA